MIDRGEGTEIMEVKKEEWQAQWYCQVRYLLTDYSMIRWETLHLSRKNPISTAECPTPGSTGWSRSSDVVSLGNESCLFAEEKLPIARWLTIYPMFDGYASSGHLDYRSFRETSIHIKGGRLSIFLFLSDL